MPKFVDHGGLPGDEILGCRGSITEMIRRCLLAFARARDFKQQDSYDKCSSDVVWIDLHSSVIVVMGNGISSMTKKDSGDPSESG
jgi:hypothetical protein